MKDMPASKIMTRSLLQVAPDQPLAAALKMMDEAGVHHLLVIERDRLVGMLSSADLLKLELLQRPGETSTAASNALGMLVRDVMQPKVAVVRENASLRDIARALTLGGFHALPVLAIDDSPVGIVTSSDLVAMLIEQIDGDALEVGAPPGTQRGVGDAALPRLRDVFHAAAAYLNSGQSAQRHAQLSRAIDRARESEAA